VVPPPLLAIVIAVMTGIACLVIQGAFSRPVITVAVFIAGVGLAVVAARRWSRKHIREAFREAEQMGRTRPFVRYKWR
jgi:membrane protein implicated in regulation of membrane protease activity